VFGHNHADLQSVTPALAHDPSVNYSTAQRPKRWGFQVEKNSRKGCDRFEKKRLGYAYPSSGPMDSLTGGSVDETCASGLQGVSYSMLVTARYTLQPRSTGSAASCIFLLITGAGPAFVIWCLWRCIYHSRLDDSDIGLYIRVFDGCNSCEPRPGQNIHSGSYCTCGEGVPAKAVLDCSVSVSVHAQDCENVVAEHHGCDGEQDTSLVRLAPSGAGPAW
jgi:hypothetical protein